MNHVVVVDASVVFKVIIEEEFSPHARALFADSRDARRSILGPPHLTSEVANAIYQRLRRRNISEAEADQAFEQFLQLPVEILPGLPELYQNAYSFAKAIGISNIYDSLYVVLAKGIDAELWTDDRPLINRVASVAPWVRWIGDYPLF